MTRPDGLEVIDISDDQGEFVAVLGTHNVFHANLVVASEIYDLGLDPSKAFASWWREVTQPDGSEYDTMWEFDENRGAPVVYWKP